MSKYFVLIVCITNACVFTGSNEQTSLERQVEELYEKDECDQVIPLITELIRIDPLKPDNYFRRAYCYAIIFEYDSSNLDYLKSIDLKHRLEDSYFNLGLNYNIVDDSIALYYYSKALEINPESDDIKFQISRALLRLNND